MTGLADTHCHLDHIERPAAEVLAEARQAGIDLVVDVGMGLAGSEAAAARASGSDMVYASVGIHPNDPSEFDADPAATMARIRELASHPRVVAIGETGLDFYRDRASPDLQERSFRAHIELAAELDKTLVIHCRDAHQRVLDVLGDAGAPARVIMHCFSGDEKFAHECSERGYFCSFAGNITYKRNDELRAAARVVPDHLLLVETDAPFLAPMPFRGKPNAPALVVHTAKALAAARDISETALLQVLHVNTRSAFVI